MLLGVFLHLKSDVCTSIVRRQTGNDSSIVMWQTENRALVSIM